MSHHHLESATLWNHPIFEIPRKHVSFLAPPLPGQPRLKVNVKTKCSVIVDHWSVRRPKIGKSLIKYVATPKFVFQYLAGTPHSLLSLVQLYSHPPQPRPAPHQTEVFILVQNLLESFPPIPTVSQDTRRQNDKFNEADAARAPVVICLIPVQNTVTTFVERALRTRIGMSSLTSGLAPTLPSLPERQRERELHKGRGFAKYFQVQRKLLLIFQLARLARLLSQRLNQLVTSRPEPTASHHLAVTPVTE